MSSRRILFIAEVTGAGVLLVPARRDPPVCSVERLGTGRPTASGTPAIENGLPSVSFRPAPFLVVRGSIVVAPAGRVKIAQRFIAGATDAVFQGESCRDG